MNDINQIVIGGNLTRDPEIKDLEGGTRITKMTIAVNRRSYRDGSRHDDTWFFHVEAWGGLADQCFRYLSKGRSIRVVGHLKQDAWQDKFNVKHELVSIVAEHIEFGPGPRQQAATVAPTAPAAPVVQEVQEQNVQEAGELSQPEEESIESDVPEENAGVQS